MQAVKESKPTQRQLEFLSKLEELGSRKLVAEFYGVAFDTVRDSIANGKSRCEEYATRVDLVEVRRRKATQNDKVTASATNTELLELANNQGFKCALSGQCIKDADNASLDHITPVSMGGTNTIENLQWVTNEINTMKGTMDQARFIELCCMVTDHYRKKEDPSNGAAN